MLLLLTGCGGQGAGQTAAPDLRETASPAPETIFFTAALAGRWDGTPILAQSTSVEGIAASILSHHGTWAAGPGKPVPG